MEGKTTLSEREMLDGASRKLLRALCVTILADARIGRAIDLVPEQNTEHILSRIRKMLREDTFRLTRI